MTGEPAPGSGEAVGAGRGDGLDEAALGEDAPGAAAVNHEAPDDDLSDEDGEVRAPDAALLAARPRRTLDDDGLDLLELALGDGLPAGAARPWRPGEVLLDAAGLTVAFIDEAGAARALDPLPAGTGPHWAPEHRRPASDLRADRDLWTAVLADEPPTRSDQQRFEARVRAGERVRLLVLVARAPRRGRPGPAAVTGAWMVIAALAGIELVVVPCPASGGPEPASLATAYGASGSVEIARERPPEEAARIAGLDGAVEREIQALYPPVAARAVLRARRSARAPGAVVLFTGLSGSGKSTIAAALAASLDGEGEVSVTLLDGDDVRRHLFRGLAADADGRAATLDRIAYVAALVAGHGGVAIAAPIAPLDEGRRAARAMAAGAGSVFVLVHVSTPLEVCEARDRRGIYARARAGDVPGFAGVNAPYEPPQDAEVVVDTSVVALEDAVVAVRRAIAAAVAGRLAAG